MIVPTPETLPSAVVVSGGKQYRVAPGDRVLVDRLRAEPGAELALDRVLLLTEGDEIKLGEALQGAGVLARVVDHRRGPKLRVLRYKSKKRVRVHRGMFKSVEEGDHVVKAAGGKPMKKK